nr:family 20 glycosylhydrolase [Clostridia bacterium]
MYIGSINKYVKSCELFKRGTKLPIKPDGAGENSDLFNGGYVSFNILTVLNTGVDLHITLSENVFVDALVLSSCTGFKSCELYIPEGASLKCVARSANGQNPIAGVYTDKLIARFDTEYTNLRIDSLELTGAVYDELNLYPIPASQTFDKGESFDLAKAGCVLCDMNDADSMFAAEYFTERLENEKGIKLEIKPLGSMFHSAVIFKKDIAIAKEHFRVRSMPNILSAMAGDRLGLLWAAVTVINAANEEGKVRPLTVNDHPYKQFRGAHFGIPRRDQIPFFKKLIKELLVPMRYNTVFIEVAGGMRYDSHPEITEAWNKRQDDFEAGLAPRAAHGAMVCGGRFLEKDEVRDIVQYIESFGIEVIPEIQSTGHVQYITMAHPEIGEVKYVEKQDANDEFAAADIRKETNAAHCFCVANERSYEILFDIAEEILEVFKPKRYVHMGHDEIYEIGVCEHCRDRDPAELLAYDINKLHDWLKARGLKMMIWSDMINSTSRYLTTPAADKIPKDIICLDFTWYFHFDKDIEENLLEKGFKVMVGNLYSSHYPRYASRIAKDGMIGGQVSMWVDTSEYQLAYEGKLYDLLYTAGILWRENYCVDARRCYDLVLRPIIRELRQKLRGESEDYDNCDELVSEDAAPLTVASPAALYAESTAAELCIDGCYDALAFVQAADRSAQRIAWNKLLEVGRYTVKYEDGTE